MTQAPPHQRGSIPGSQSHLLLCPDIWPLRSPTRKEKLGNRSFSAWPLCYLGLSVFPKLPRLEPFSDSYNFILCVDGYALLS